MNFADLTKSLVSAFTTARAEKLEEDALAAQVGKLVCIRTVTMVNTGRLVAILPDAYVLENALWIANTGKWATFCKDCVATEIEPFPAGPTYVFKAGIIDVIPMAKTVTLAK